MVKHTQTIRRQFADELFECDHFVGLALKGLIPGLCFCFSMNLQVGDVMVIFFIQGLSLF